MPRARIGHSSTAGPAVTWPASSSGRSVPLSGFFQVNVRNPTSTATPTESHGGLGPPLTSVPPTTSTSPPPPVFAPPPPPPPPPLPLSPPPPSSSSSATATAGLIGDDLVSTL